MVTRVSFLLIAWSAVASAQVTQQIDVAITNVDLVVTDARGNPVTGLMKDDLELREGDLPREITHFVEISGRDNRPATPPAPRAILLLFDNTTLNVRNRKVAASALAGFAAKSLRPIDRAAVAVLIPSLQWKLSWSNDLTAITSAIAQTTEDAAGAREQQRRLAEQQIRDVIEYARTAPDRVPVSFDEATQAVHTYAASATHDTRARLSALSSAISLLRSRSGRRIIVVVGEGFVSNPGADLFSQLNTAKLEIESGQGPQRLRGSARMASPLTDASRYSVAEDMRAVTAKAAAAGIVLYAVNPGQTETSGGKVQQTTPSDDAALFRKADDSRSGDHLLVSQTGGLSFFGVPPEIAFQRIHDDLNSYYSVAFRSEGPPAQISAKSRSGHRVRVSRAPRASRQSMDEMVLAHLVAPLESNDLHISLQLGAIVAGAERRTVPVRVVIPVDRLDLASQGSRHTGGFAVYVASGNERGDATAVNRQEHRIDWSPDMFRSAMGKTLTFSIDVGVPAGLDRISVGVADLKSGRTGFQRVTIGH